jgi:hypothetical protein
VYRLIAAVLNNKRQSSNSRYIASTQAGSIVNAGNLAVGSSRNISLIAKNTIKRMFEKYRKLRSRPLNPPFLNAEGYILGDFQSDSPQNWGLFG